MTRFISVPVKGACQSPDPDGLVLTLYGPRGGTRAIEALTAAAARRLADELNGGLVRDLWRFIEDSGSLASNERTDRFFALRERVREMGGGDE